MEAKIKGRQGRYRVGDGSFIYNKQAREEELAVIQAVKKVEDCERR